MQILFYSCLNLVLKILLSILAVGRAVWVVHNFVILIEGVGATLLIGNKTRSLFYPKKCGTENLQSYQILYLFATYGLISENQ
jgi:hypothetical protein